MRKTIAIDFDGVIHKYSKGWHDGSLYDGPVEGAIPAIERLQKDYAVLVISTRKPSDMLNWFLRLKEWHLPIRIVPDDMQFWNEQEVGLSNRKLPAIAYIDDRGIRFTNWTDMLNYF